MEKARFSFIFRKRGDFGMLLFFPCLIAVAFSRPVLQLNLFWNFSANGIGWVFFVLYVTLRLWSTLYIGGWKDERLQTQGPYSVTRNPLYLGSFCLASAISFFLKSLTLLAVTGLMILIYWKVIRIEEAFLERKFGEAFKAYCRKAPRLFPSFSSHHSEEIVPVQLRALKHEAKRLWASALIPIVLQILMVLRTSPAWPHFFTLP